MASPASTVQQTQGPANLSPGSGASSVAVNLLRSIAQAIDAQTIALENVFPQQTGTTATAGGSASLYLSINVNGVPYKIALLSP
jgi:hypothetical protein